MKALWQRRKKWIIAGGVLLALALGLFLLPRFINQPAAIEAATVDAAAARAEVTVGDLVSEASAGGEIVAGRAAALALMTGGTIAEIPVEVGDAVRAGDVLLRLETAELERAVGQAEQARIAQEAALATLTAAPTAAQLASAEAAVRSAQVQLDDLLDGPSAAELAAAEADLRAAQADLGAASARLNSATAPADANALRAAQIALDTAQAAATSAAERHSTILVTEPNQFLDAETLATMEEQARAAAQQANADLAAAQQAYDDLANGQPSSVAASQASVASAAAQRDAAQAQFDLLQAGPSATDVAAARSSLAQAERQLEQLVSGPDEATRVSSEVAVEQARLREQWAARNLAEATLLAPFDGVITAVNARPGETAAGVVVEMIDPASLELLLHVDEVDIAQVSPGQAAVVTLETWPDAALPAEVLAIVPQPVTGSELVVYEVRLGLGETELALRAGMTADATLTTGELAGALLLPSEAIEVDRASGVYSVRRVTAGADGAETAEVVEVTVGRRSGGFTQITGGLEAGDVVLIGDSLPVESFIPGP
ncbi:putative Efflux transporter, RND family, MFP subunit [Candidatus Promineifilum breve]|uniref:Efflux transporter, RND family, MFP subunit n=1 Tax=Candidatus Promineifilum breve TaxID=1806508 RepID=A0A170PG51_9CHLR|nr:HlyD family efflux transporter periplasmic adaptor subunit [Candidatus Promineifilum breve]CUS03563.2 putative Efflux transporter, RND family, MFP subunit [Candidatus Promineifilum breve]